MITLLALITLVLALLPVPRETVIAPAIATAALALYVAVVRRWFRVVPGYDELHMVRTADGWTLPLYRYRAETPRGAVLMVHGIYSTMGIFDVGEDMSLARHLRSKGYDVYCLELRDSGVHGRRSRWYALKSEGAGFDDYVAYDYPAAVAHVQRVSGFDRIGFVGHSMGGMIFYPFGGTDFGARSISRAVTLGSLAALPEHRWLRFLPIPWRLLARIPHYGISQLASYVMAPFVGVLWIVELFFMNPANVAAKHRRRYFFTGVANSPHALITHFASMYRTRRIASRDGKTDFEVLHRQNRVPTLVIGSPNDHIAPFTLVQKGFDALAGEKRFVEVSKKAGLARNFGHNDLVLGWAARDHIWPQIEAWLEPGPESQA